MGLEKTYSGLHTQSSSVEHWERAPKKGSFPSIPSVEHWERGPKKGSFPSISIVPLKISHEPTKPYYTFNY